MITGNPEKNSLNEQYYNREKLVSRIVDQAALEAQTEINPDSRPYKLLILALTTPPISLPIWLDRIRCTDQELLQSISPLVTSLIKHRITQGRLSVLQRACQFDQRILTEVAIDIADQDLPPAFQTIFAQDLDGLQRITENGDNLAVASLLRLVEGDTPLNRYRRDLIAGRIKLELAFARGKVGSLPTRIPNVDLRSHYPRDKQVPKLSFVVKPFD